MARNPTLADGCAGLFLILGEGFFCSFDACQIGVQIAAMEGESEGEEGVSVEEGGENEEEEGMIEEEGGND